MRMVSLQTPNQAQLILTIPLEVGEAHIFTLVMSPGNVRFGTNPEQLNTPEFVGQLPGLPQNVAAGEVTRWWAGDLWAISDTPNTIVQAIVPLADAYIRRNMGRARI